jgi:hypothetical protein
MQNDMFKIIGMLIVSFFIIYIVVKSFQLQASVVEGLTNADGTTTPSSVPLSGEAGTAASYAAAIKAKVVQLQDELLIAKYRPDYEQVIINMDDYVGYLMLQQILNMKLDGDVKTNIEYINNLNILKSSKDSLNTAMTFLDKQ